MTMSPGKSVQISAQSSTLSALSFKIGSFAAPSDVLVSLCGT
jgi:hypothetical protein